LKEKGCKKNRRKTKDYVSIFKEAIQGSEEQKQGFRQFSRGNLSVLARRGRMKFK
jgi:hypothetical protein